MQLQDKTAIVTGGARRVGRAIAVEFARAGCNVAVHYHRSATDAETLATEVRHLGRRVHLIQADLDDPDSWPFVVHETVRVLGAPAVLINNAAVFERMTLDDFDPAVWERTFRTNVTAVAGLCRYAAPHLRRERGKIVNLTDISAERPWSKHLAYCASKAALLSLTRALAKSLAPQVQVNAVAPGIAVFPEDYDDRTQTDLIAQVPLKRAGTPEDVAQAVRFLCEDADYVTGQVINVDGGRSIA